MNLFFNARHPISNDETKPGGREANFRNEAARHRNNAAKHTRHGNTEAAERQQRLADWCAEQAEG